MTAGLGHNGGPTMERGTAWRRHAWGEARRALLPRLPLEVIRTRVRRAREIGLDYPTYAMVRATTGRDIIAFLFSSNALGLLRAGDLLPPDRRARLAGLRRCDRMLAAQPPLDPERIATGIEAAQDVALAPAFAAPGLAAGWAETRRRLAAGLGSGRVPRDGVVVVGCTALERDWCATGGMAGYLSAARYFAPRNDGPPVG